jgi:hypothetical protein
MDTQEPSTPLNTSRSEDFANKYANHVQFELSAWDLKLIFGQQEQFLGPNAVLQHTAVVLPWPQIKIMAYLLQVNLAVHEQLNGRVHVPGGIIPDPERIIAGAAQFRDSDSEAIKRLMIERYEAFVKENPEAAGEGLTNKSKKK